MDSARKAVLTEELDAAIRQRDELTVVIEYLSKLVGRSTDPEQKSDAQADLLPPSPNAEPADLIGEGEFFGKSSTEAAAEVLARVGRTRPLKTQAIFEAITKGGVKVGAPDALYRSLFRNSKFTKVGKSLWGLTEWYPTGAVKSARSDLDAVQRLPAASQATPEEDSGEDQHLAGQEDRETEEAML